MPLVVKQALAARLTNLPELQTLLADVALLSGVPIRFWPAAAHTESGAGSTGGAESSGLCKRIQIEDTGCRYCFSFRQKLRERAVTSAASARCDAGLQELLVPVTVGGVIAGHLVASGLRDGLPHPTADNRARHLLTRLGVNLRAEEITRLRATAPMLAAERIEALSRVLQAGAEHLGRIMLSHLAHAPTGAPELIERVYRIVHADYGRRLRVPDLARRLEISAAHLSRTFHQATGLRLVDYIARYRAERARTLLTETTRPIADIARSSGFASIAQFNRVFRATFGSPPRQIRAKEKLSAPDTLQD